MKNNVPLDVAFSLSDLDRAAWCIIFSEQNDRIVFDWDTMSFKEDK